MEGQVVFTKEGVYLKMEYKTSTQQGIGWDQRACQLMQVLQARNVLQSKFWRHSQDSFPLQYSIHSSSLPYKGGKKEVFVFYNRTKKGRDSKVSMEQQIPEVSYISRIYSNGDCNNIRVIVLADQLKPNTEEVMTQFILPIEVFAAILVIGTIAEGIVFITSYLGTIFFFQVQLINERHIIFDTLMIVVFIF